MELASLELRSVGSLRGFDSRASVGQCSNWIRRRRVCAWARYPYVRVCVNGADKVLQSHLGGPIRD